MAKGGTVLAFPKKGAAAADADRIELGDGAYLYRRSDSKKGLWQVYAYVDGAELKRSTGTAIDREAIAKAREMISEARERKAKGKALAAPPFSVVAKRYITDKLDSMADCDLKTKSIERIERYIIPYFDVEIGRKFTSAITDYDVEGYEDWRNAERQKLVAAARKEHEKKVEEAKARWHGSKRIRSYTPKLEDYLPEFTLGSLREQVSSTALNFELGIVRAIFEHAAKKGLILKTDIPVVKGVEVDQKPRLGLKDHELEKLRKTAWKRFVESREAAVARYMKRMKLTRTIDDDPKKRLVQSGEGWVGDAEAWSRFIVMHVIDILAGTGMRPSTLVRLKLRQIEEHSPAKAQTDELGRRLPRYIISEAVTMKGGKQRKWSVVPDRMCWPSFRLLLHYTNGNPNTPLIGVSSAVIGKGIKKLMVECEISNKKDGVEKSMYDLRHYYINKKLKEGVPLAIVAKNTMTSIAMIQRYYEHIATDEAYDILSGQ